MKNSMINFNKLRNKTVLITGASGLIGINLLKSLKPIRKEYNIKIFTWNKTNNSLNDLFSDCVRIISDMTDIETYKTLPKFDFIIHSSGYGQPNKFLSDKLKTIEINTLATIKLLELLKYDGTFLFISSSEVYNGLNKYGITEDEVGLTNTEHPRATYIEGKKCGEVICNSYREKGFNVKVARVSMTYGSGTQLGDTRVVNSLIDKGLKNGVIELLDDGSSLRTVCYVSDVVDMLWNIIFDGQEFVYNVGGVDTYSILELAEKIGSIINCKVIKSNVNNGLVGNSKLVNLSIDRYVNEFGETEFKSLEYGLSKTIEWQKKLYGNN